MLIIQQGRVRVNGRVVSEPSTEVDGSEKISVNGKAVGVKSYSYIMLHKPVGVTTTKDDPFADRTVMDLLPKDLAHVAPVGRLDKESEGLLLLTNDGDLAFHLTHPKFHLNKTYEVTVTGRLKPEAEAELKKGIMLDGIKTAPCQIKNVRYNDATTDLTMIIHEGRKRQIRLMLLAKGHVVKRLVRTAIGSVSLGDLKSGKWRTLTDSEIRTLNTLTKTEKKVAP